ncbi:MAG TPA: hypothetical protein DCL13_03800, partial [Peptococcaceae bacterium]|nr:hypothetical protein [Peptococcaceae bacterium]
MMRKVARRLPVLALVFCILSGLLLLPVLSERAEAQSYNDLALKAVQFNHQAYMNGTQLDAYDAYVLTLAGANVSSWVYQSKSLKDAVIESVYTTLENPAGVSAKQVAYQLLVTDHWGYDNLSDQLANILGERQQADGSFDNNIYSDIPAYEALARAGKITVVNATCARQYLLSTQCTVAGETYGAWAGPWGPDFVSTAQAIRALTYLPGAAGDAQIQKAITDGLAWMQKQQQVDGSVYVTTPWPDDPLIDTAETIFTLKALGTDPATWKSSQGKTPVDWMVEKARSEE